MSQDTLNWNSYPMPSLVTLSREGVLLRPFPNWCTFAPTTSITLQTTPGLGSYFRLHSMPWPWIKTCIMKTPTAHRRGHSRAHQSWSNPYLHQSISKYRHPTAQTLHLENTLPTNLNIERLEMIGATSIIAMYWPISNIWQSVFRTSRCRRMCWTV